MTARRRTHPLPVPVLIWYDQDTDTYRIEKGRRFTKFDLSEEGMAKMARFLKTLAPIAERRPTPTKAALPTPTAEELVTKAFRYANAAPAHNSLTTGGKRTATETDLLDLDAEIKLEMMPRPRHAN